MFQNGKDWVKVKRDEFIRLANERLVYKPCETGSCHMTLVDYAIKSLEANVHR